MALIFGMLQNLVGLYQVCSNYDTMANYSTILVVVCFAKAVKMKKILSLTTRPRALVFGM